MKRACAYAWAAAATLLVGSCATDGAGGGVDLYGGFYYDDWYAGGCCVDYPGEIGPPPPRPEHPIANPPQPKPSHPIATPPMSRPMPAPRPMARGGGGRR